MDLYETIDHWQRDYCGGYKMPYAFREYASEMFNQVYINRDVCPDNICDCNQLLYRIVRDISPEKLYTQLQFDDKYYSFSNTLKGVKNVAKKDRELKKDIILIISKPNHALNLNNLLLHLYENYNLTNNRYSDEDEIVSKLTSEDVVEIYYISNSRFIAEYNTKGQKLK